MKLIGIVGFIGSGKDTVAEEFAKYGCAKDSFAKPLKDVCSAVFGWPREMLEGDTIESRDFRETPDMFWTRKLGIDNFTPRLALQLLGTDVMRDHFHKDIWLNSLEYRLRAKKNSKCIVVSDTRFRNELDLVKKLGGSVIWVQRGELPEWYEIAKDAHHNAVCAKIMRTRYKDVHESEWNWAGYNADYIIQNNGTIDDLHEQVHRIYKEMFTSALKIV
jgi:dephospho-CoA kinase